MSTPLRIGFIPLVDVAPLVVAHEIGFAEEEGLALDLVAAPSWSTLRDHLALGQIEAAHMLTPIPVAMALGLGGMPDRFDIVSMLSVNGNVIGVSKALAERMQLDGHGFGFDDAWAAGRALLEVAPGRLRMGVPFPFSMHAELVYHWLGALGVRTPQDLDVRTVPPPMMAEALAEGQIDAFCVGEPWGSVAVEGGHGALLLPGAAIWASAPEKGIAVRRAWAEADPELVFRLIRAVWRAQRWLAKEGNHSTASELLARRAYLDRPAELIERALTGQMVVTPGGTRRDTAGFVRFFEGSVGFPWRSQAVWISDRLAARTGMDRTAAAEVARGVFRTDLYRAAVRGLGADLPGASDRKSVV